MARYHMLGRVVDTYGNSKANENITIYLADTVTSAIIYKSKTGGTGISSVPQITSDAHGRFSFYVDDSDYNIGQLFDIVTAGLTYEDIEILITRSHSSLTNLTTDDHPQYAALSQNEIVTGKWLFSNSVSGQTPTKNTHLTRKDYVDSHTSTNILSVSAASLEQDNREREQTNIQILSVSAASDEADQKHKEWADTMFVSVSAAADEADNREREYVNVQILSISAASIEQDNRLQENIDITENKVNSHLASANVHFLESSIDIGNIAVSAHKHPSSDITDFEDIDDRISNLLTEGPNVKLTYNDGANTLEISAGAAADGGVTDHGALTGLTDYDHPQYARDDLFDSHLASASVHFLESSIDHTNIQNIGTRSHTPLDTTLDNIQSELNTHEASGSAHFLESSIDIGNIAVSAHKHPSSDITNFEDIDDRISNLLIEGNNIQLTYNDAANTLEISAAHAGAGAGETNTASNLGTGEGIYFQKVDVDLQFKSLIAGTNIDLTSTGNDITISAAHPGAGGGVTDHGALTGLTDYDHPQYARDDLFDSHLASASVHFLESSIDHTNIQNIGTRSHTPLDTTLDNIQSELNTHEASGSAHFLESSIDIGNIAVSAHKHPSSDITNFEDIDDRISNLLIEGNNIQLTYNDAANTLEISAAHAGAGGDPITGATEHAIVRAATATTLEDSGITISDTDDMVLPSTSSLKCPEKLVIPTNEPDSLENGCIWIAS